MSPAELSERLEHPQHEERRTAVLHWLMTEREIVRIHRGKGHHDYETLSTAIDGIAAIGRELEEKL